MKAQKDRYYKSEKGAASITRYKQTQKYRDNVLRSAARRRERWNGGNPYRVHLGPLCERCGFVPEDRCQLDIHHRDGDHDNNEPGNLQTVCANCHRLLHKAGIFED